MPTYLQRVVESVGPDLDEKARKALVELDGVNSLSILQKLTERGEEVRNRSAFVCTAAKSARDRGGVNGAGPEQLKCALDRLKSEGIIDENAVDVLTKGLVPRGEACAAVSNMLQQEQNSVRNPSAYITRSVTNAKKSPRGPQGPPQMQSGGYGGGYSPLAAPARPAPVGVPGAFELFAKYKSVLDEKAQTALNSLTADQAAGVLQALESRGATVNNPSAWVCKSVGNAGSGGGLPSGGAPLGYAPPGYAPAAYAGYGGCGKGGYGFDGKGCGKSCYSAGGYGMAKGGRNLPRHPLVNALDERAQEGLEEVGMEAATAILQQLESQMGKINNPSAYVLRAVGNARKGKGAGGEVGGVPPQRQPGQGDFLGRWRANLDPDAVSALEGVEPDAARAILAELEAKAGKVRNPSAYVVKAVGNAKQGKQAPGVSTTASDGLGAEYGAGGDNVLLEGVLGRWRGSLDLEAITALGSVDPEHAGAILAELELKEGSVRNPSAYVVKAVGNAKQGRQLPGMSTRVKKEGQNEELQVELARHALDEKAQQALQELELADALDILAHLTQQSSSIGNPSAYVMKSVGNKKNGMDGRSAKRPRTDVFM